MGRLIALLIVIKLWQKSPQPAVLGDTVKSSNIVWMCKTTYSSPLFIVCSIFCFSHEKYA